jgi:hypothetical protein
MNLAASIPLFFTPVEFDTPNPFYLSLCRSFHRSLQARNEQPGLTVSATRIGMVLVADARSGVNGSRDVSDDIREGRRARTLAEAVTRAKNSINDSDARLTYVLFGDPTIKVK